MLASHGLDQVKIQALARWHSPMLGYYAGLGPLKAITAEFRSRASSASSSRPRHAPVALSSAPLDGDNSILLQLAAMSGRIDALLRREQQLEAELSATPTRPVAPAFVVNLDSGR